MRTTLLTLISALILTGCGHNIATYVDGQEVSLAGLLVYRNGKILQANIKENSSVNLEANAKNDTTADQTSGTEAVVKFTLTTGEQVTGYQVELAEVQAEAKTEAK